MRKFSVGDTVRSSRIDAVGEVLEIDGACAALSHLVRFGKEFYKWCDEDELSFASDVEAPAPAVEVAELDEPPPRWSFGFDVAPAWLFGFELDRYTDFGPTLFGFFGPFRFAITRAE